MSTPAEMQQHQRRVDVIGRTWLFDSLTSPQVQAVADALRPLEVPAGTTVVSAGDRADALYLVEEGVVQVETTTPGGAPRPMARLGPGEFFGEAALTAGAHRTATVRAHTPGRLWELPREDLVAVVEANPSVGATIARSAALRGHHRASGGQGVDTTALAGVTTLSQGETVTLGRAPDNDIVLASRMVSDHHAVIMRTGEGLVLTDRSSLGNTYVNGTPIARALLKDGDHVVLGDVHLRHAGAAMAEVEEPYGIRIDAVGLRKDVSADLNLIQDVSLSIAAGEFVAIVGGSGAGKSTLMDALSGVRPATAGEVHFDGLDARAHRDRFRTVLGYVPQDDIIHRDLTVRATMRYAAQLRLPDDTPRAIREVAVEEALKALQLQPEADTTVSALSGGQRKRASIGVELLTEPKVFFLDEPTSGLDPATDTALMQQLRDLSRRGSTVVLTTHATKNVRLCDKVCVLAKGGHLAFFGTPDEALAHFQVADFDEIYNRLAQEESPAAWGARFRASASPTTVPLRTGEVQAGQPTSGRHRRGGLRHTLRQFVTLSRRNAAVFVRNRDRLAPLLIQPVAFALLLVALFEPDLLRPDSPNLPSTVLLIFMLPFSVFLFGLILGVQEIVTEQAILRRERLVDLRIAPYVLSKLTLLAPALTVGSVLILAILRITDRLPALSAGTFGLLLLTMVLSVLVGLALALFTSSLAPNPQAANDLVLAWVMPQVLFAGGLFPIASMIGVGEAISVAMPLRYGLQAAAEIVGLTGIWEASDLPVALTLRETYAAQFEVSVTTQLLVLVGVVVAFLALTMVILARRTPR